MRKTLSLIFVIILMGTLCVFPVAAAGSGKISMSNAEAKPGDTVTLTVNMSSNPGLATLEFQVEFDTDVLELTKVEDTGLLNGTYLNTNYGSPYKIAWVDDSATENTKTGSIAILTFKIRDNAIAGKTKVELKSLQSYDFNAEKNTFTVSAGEITVENILCESHTFNDMEPLGDTDHGRTCSVCNYAEKEKHSYSQWNITDASHSRTCEACGYAQEGSHDWDGGAVIRSANCREGGQIKYTCTLCQSSYIEDTDPNGEHVYNHGCDADCNLCGDTRVTEHTFNTKWSNDKTHHWYECFECKEKKDVAEHIPGEEATEQKPQTCIECGFVIMPALSHKHEPAEAWSTDEQGHWYVCSGCIEQVDYAEHVFADACDADCDVCGYVREAVHTYPEGWLTDAENHWRICDFCGEQILFAAHIPGVEATADAPQYCTECGYELAPALKGEKIPLANLWDVDYGWPWWANTIAIAVILGGIAVLIIVPLSKKKH